MSKFIGNSLNHKTNQHRFNGQQDRARVEYSSLYGMRVFQQVNVFDHKGLNNSVALINAITLAPMKLIGANTALVLANTLKCSWNMTGSKIINHLCGPVRPIILDKTPSVDKKIDYKIYQGNTSDHLIFITDVFNKSFFLKGLNNKEKLSNRSEIRNRIKEKYKNSEHPINKIDFYFQYNNGLSNKENQFRVDPIQDRALIPYLRCYYSFYKKEVFQVNAFDSKFLNNFISLINAVTLAPFKLIVANALYISNNFVIDFWNLTARTWNYTGSKIITHIFGPKGISELSKKINHEIHNDKKFNEFIKTSMNKTLKNLENLTSESKKTYSFKDLIPSIIVIAFGILLSPAFSIGLAVGDLVFFAKRSTSLLVSHIWPEPKVEVKTSVNSKNDEFFIKTHPYITSVRSPVIEEIAFRGILQPVFTILTRSSVIGNIFQAALFGYVHLFNKPEGAKHQAANCFASGLVYGVLNNRFGFIAPVAAHIINNTIAMAGLLSLSLQLKKLPDKENKDLELKDARAAG